MIPKNRRGMTKKVYDAETMHRLSSVKREKPDRRFRSRFVFDFVSLQRDFSEVFHDHMKIQRISLSCSLACLLATQTFAMIGNAAAADSAEEQVKMLMERHNQVLKQVSHAVLYHKKEGSKPEINKYAWFNEAGELLKVAIERDSDTGLERKEYFPFEPDGDPQRMMTVAVTRREIPVPNDATRIEEESLYLARSASGGLVTLQKLTKTKDFKAGRFIEMEDVPNVVHAPEPQGVEVNSDEAARREREFFEEPKKIAQALRAAGAPVRDPAAEGREAAAARARKAQEQRSVSPDGKWEFRLASPNEGESSDGNFVVAKRGSAEPSVTLSEEASGSFAERANIVWAPDSKRFAFNYAPGLRVRAVQFFQLHGDEWRELDSPDSDDAISAPIERSMAAQRKKLKLSPKKIGRPISDGCQVRKWIDPDTVLLHVFSNETFEIKNELEEVGEACFVTLKFDAAGEWKIARTRLLMGAGVPELNKLEEEELARLEKESD